MQLHWKIIIGMMLGGIFGVFSSNFGFEDLVAVWIKPWGIIFINSLKLIAVPLVFASIVKGISGLKNISSEREAEDLTLDSTLMRFEHDILPAEIKSFGREERQFKTSLQNVNNETIFTTVINLARFTL